MANKNVTLKDNSGNNLYPITIASNVSGLSSQISNLDTQIGGKANIDGSNIQKNVYANLAFPDFDTYLKFTNGQAYRAPCDGYVYTQSDASSTHWHILYTYNTAGTRFSFVEYSYDGNAYNAHNHFVPVAKGTRFMSSGRVDNGYFFPCRGAVLSGEWTGDLPTATV